VKILKNLRTAIASTQNLLVLIKKPSFLSPEPPSKWDTWFGGSRWWHCELASNNSTLHLMKQSAQTKKNTHSRKGQNNTSIKGTETL